MSEELNNEIEVINSIYGDNTIRTASDSAAPNDHILAIPQGGVTLRLSIPDRYPDAALQITAVESVGTTSRKGFGSHVFAIAREVVQKAFTPGHVCLFDLLQELEQALDVEPSTDEEEYAEDRQCLEHGHAYGAGNCQTTNASSEIRVPPQWALSSTVSEKKSVFVARACAVNSTLEARSAIANLLSTDKRTCKATHNISAYRARAIVDGNEVVYQDCDDDGEAAAGGRLLKLLQMMDIWNTLVVVSRWYGGVKLGPARFGIINAVAREAVVAGGFAKG
ncbi:MAG: hypothetical protein Q9225_000751 [Loekoesia sp. 1 TL-2023]